MSENGLIGGNVGVESGVSDIEIDARKWAVEQAMAWAKNTGEADIDKVQELAGSLARFVLGPKVESGQQAYNLVLANYESHTRDWRADQP